MCGQADVYNSDGSVKKASIPGLGGAIESGFSGDFGSILSYTNGGLLWVGKDYCAVEKMQVSGFVKRWINVDSSQCIGVLSTGKIIVVET
ncbi:MAG: hypothetical protein IPN71_10035 [Fibrobacteres bacterium]|nr:hypothetical protein [Fibrobacterota bacterium]